MVHAWVGNSEGVAEDHYLMATDEDFDRAAGKATLKATLSALVTAAQAWSGEKETAVSPAIARDTAVLSGLKVPPRGVEGTADFPNKTELSIGGGAESGAVGEETAQLINLLGSLSPAQRELLLAIARART